MTRKTVKVSKDDDTTSESSSSSNSDSESSSTSSSSESSSSTESTTAEETGPDGDHVKDTKTVVKKPSIGKLGNTKRRRRRIKVITICLTNCRYDIVRRVARKYNLKEVNEDEAWNIYWTDFSVSLERAMDMRRFQIVNHFPGMNEICRKDLLARNLNRMRKLFPKEYDIYPKTWSLPADLGELQNYAHVRRNKTFICKPEMGCQGRGIFLIRNIKDLNPFGKIICQLYIAKPLLIDDFKFDLRMYVLITSCDPLRVYVYKEGLARFATAKYKAPTNTNTENSYMHLTNYAVNKFSRDYIVDDEAGSKRKLSAVYRWLETRNYDMAALTESIDEVILKTIISAHPVLRHNYRTCFPNHDTCSACFEILGFDILIDHKLKPFVLEVNHSPSFHTDARLDLEIKEGLVNDTLNMLNVKRLDRHKVQHDDRRRVQERLLVKHNSMNNNSKPIKKDIDSPSEIAPALEAQFAHELEFAGGFRLIYPGPNSDKYDLYFEQNTSSLYGETAASQARAQCTRSQIQEYNQKKQEEETKRVGGPKEPAQQQKDKARPESPADQERSEQKLKKKNRPCISNSFQPLQVDAGEELERMKGIMHRGMLVRSLGIEAQVFQLLCQVGTIKPDEERLFRRMHGYGFNNLAAQIDRATLNCTGSRIATARPVDSSYGVQQDEDGFSRRMHGFTNAFTPTTVEKPPPVFSFANRAATARPPETVKADEDRIFSRMHAISNNFPLHATKPTVYPISDRKVQISGRQVETVKPEEDRIFRRIQGFSNFSPQPPKPVFERTTAGLRIRTDRQVDTMKTEDRIFSRGHGLNNLPMQIGKSSLGVTGIRIGTAPAGRKH